MRKKGIILPSTRDFVREARQAKGFSLFNLLHGYIYARWTYFYISMGIGTHPLARRLGPVLNWIGNLIVANAPGEGQPPMGLADTYHGKVLPLASARELVSVKEDICLGDLEKVIPYALARDIILKNPDHIAVLDCPCRAAREHPCLPMDVCLIVGEPFASFTVEHQPKHARWVTSEEAQAIIQAEDARGHVHHAFFKDAMMGRFYAICNCCTCCCGAMQAQRSGTPMLASSGYVAQVDETNCTQCGKCSRTCPFDAIHIDGAAVIDLEQCMGCGICVGQCRQKAIELVLLESKGIPLSIRGTAA
jgi:Pyruvate/2-oxoacid:ferredoxin oxidoreductase delta subunit